MEVLRQGPKLGSKAESKNLYFFQAMLILLVPKQTRKHWMKAPKNYRLTFPYYHHHHHHYHKCLVFQSVHWGGTVIKP